MNVKFSIVLSRAEKASAAEITQAAR